MGSKDEMKEESRDPVQECITDLGIVVINCVQFHRRNHVEGTSELSTGDLQEGSIYPLVSTPPQG